MLRDVREALDSLHDLFMLDLDGVVYISGRVVPGVPEFVAGIRSAGAAVAFVTNNASRPASVVASTLRGMGVAAEPGDVVTSAQAAASLLRRRLPAGTRVLVLGGPGLRESISDAGLEPVSDATDVDVAAVVTGYGPDVLWRDVMRTAMRIRDGLPWVASNTDSTIPTDYGLAPGHGVLVRTLADFAGVEPEVAGKPSPPLLQETIARVGGRSPVMVGDRLDTDIAGGRALGIASLLVMTGVTGLAELVAAPPELRPSYLAPTLAGALVPHPAPVLGPDGARSAGWHARVADDALLVDGEGSAADWWRCAAVAAWDHLDRTGHVPGVDGLEPPVDDGALAPGSGAGGR